MDVAKCTGPRTTVQEEAMESSDSSSYKVASIQIPRRVSLRRRVLEYNLVQLQARQLAMQERDIQIRSNYERLRASRQNLIAACEEEEDDFGDNEASDVETEKNLNHPNPRRRSKRHAKNSASGFFRTLTKKLRHADCSSGNNNGSNRSASASCEEYENKHCTSDDFQEFKMAAPEAEVAMDDRSADTNSEIPGLVRSQAIMNLALQLRDLKGSSTCTDEPPSPNKENHSSEDSEDTEMDYSTTSSTSTIPVLLHHNHHNHQAHHPPQRSSSLCLSSTTTPKSKSCKITKHRSLRLPSMLRCKPRVYDNVAAEMSPPPNKKGKHEQLSLSSPGYACSGNNNGKSYSVPAAPLPRRRALSVKFTPVQWKDIS